MKHYTPSIRTRFVQWLAWHMPRDIAYWCAIRVVTHASTHALSNVEMGAITAVEALEEWEAHA